MSDTDHAKNRNRGTERQRLFIYGTLRRGGRAENLMQDAEYLTDGYVRGRLIHIDQYPGLLLDGNTGGRVIGELYAVDPILLKELDRYEGCFESPPHYLRQSIQVTLDSGEEQVADTYVFQLPQPHHEIIQSGDWFSQVPRM